MLSQYDNVKQLDYQTVKRCLRVSETSIYFSPAVLLETDATPWIYFT
jgi:hypothetical protein